MAIETAEHKVDYEEGVDYGLNDEAPEGSSIKKSIFLANAFVKQLRVGN